MTKVLTVGEMMLRLKPQDHQRILQANTFEANYGGSEANVAVSLALLGDDAQYLTKLPNNALGQMAAGTLRQYAVDTTKLLWGGPRLGIYFFEKGASIRSTNVVYDRAGSSFALAQAAEFDWDSLFAGVDYFYFSGITPALSDELAQAMLDAVKYCQAHHITVVVDANYRGKMWSPAKAQQVMSQLMPYVNVFLANDEDFEASLGIPAFDGDMRTGIDQLDSFKAAMAKVAQKYPNIHTIASVVRNIHSVEDHQCTALLWQNGQTYQGPVYQMHVYEGVASGDAFGAGLVHGLIHEFDPQDLIDYADTASALKLTISGDLNLISDADIRATMHSAGGVNR
ncbi:PfkB family carbohydrate kinase [Lacticaseibacillus baoqingensis]|uniref:PfkB family carbohydrate kinase n=1 Tax=Lacticaseibacillus baoqingensis TaxID=2486013 RepID=A0ABW4E7A0_9LACO|nr:sugar kinase [Lacticaseibacillus baoqingensis]